jgi:CBS domain containing-hemolysin-like protein
MNPADIQSGQIAQLIQLAVGPVFLISGVGVTLNVLTSRLARIVDRSRRFEELREVSNDQARIADLDKQLRVMAKRSRYINAALTLATISALATAIVVVLLFANAFVRVNFGPYIALLFVAAMVCLAGAFLAFLIEVRIATAALRIGVPSGTAKQ